MIKSTWLFMIGIVTFVVGILAGYGGNVLDFLIFSPEASIFLITLAVFSFSFLFFGFPSPVILLFVGMHAGWLLRNMPGSETKVIVLTTSCLLASLSSIILGTALLEDMRGTGNFKKVLKFSLILIFIGILASAGFDLMG